MNPSDDRLQPEQRFKANMRARREDAGLSQAQFAEAMRERGFRWHPSTVYEAESGERKIPLNEAAAISDLLGVGLSELVQAEATALAAQGIRGILDSIQESQLRAIGALTEMLNSRRYFEEFASRAVREGVITRQTVRTIVESTKARLLTWQDVFEAASEHLATADVPAEWRRVTMDLGTDPQGGAEEAAMVLYGGDVDPDPSSGRGMDNGKHR